jgi:uncharacterized protein (DUF433 family)
MAVHERLDHIVRDPHILGGEPTIKGTRIPVRSIVIIHQLYGDFEQVRRAFPTAPEPALREALAFYKSHRAEIDRHIQENESDVDA